MAEKARIFAWRTLNPVIDLGRAIAAILAYPRFLLQVRRYRRLGGEVQLSNLYPQLHDRTGSPFDQHYFFQDAWAAQRIAEVTPDQHVDVGSRIDFVAFLTSITDVTFVDIRPFEAELDGLAFVQGTILDLPFEDASVTSLSCLHVAEHIGLGRYGDSLNPDGTQLASRELARVVAPGGRLLFSGPVGRTRTMFNAHRIHDPREIVAMFDDLELIEFAGVDDWGKFSRNRSIDELVDSEYACGMFLFERPTN